MKLRPALLGAGTLVLCLSAEILYDSATLRRLDSFDQAVVPLEKRPEWSSSGLTRSAGE